MFKTIRKRGASVFFKVGDLRIQLHVMLPMAVGLHKDYHNFYFNVLDICMLRTESAYHRRRGSKIWGTTGLNERKIAHGQKQIFKTLCNSNC